MSLIRSDCTVIVCVEAVGEGGKEGRREGGKEGRRERGRKMSEGERWWTL
jgi:hypothetical protein